MSRKVFEALKKTGPLMQWAEQHGYQPPETVESLTLQIFDTENEIWHIEGMIEEGNKYDLEDDLPGLYLLLSDLKRRRDILAAEEGEDDFELNAVILHIRPAGAADE